MSLLATPNEHATKLHRVRDRLGKELVMAKKPLPGGDYMFDAHGKIVAIEVKWSLGDLFESLKVVGENGGPRLAVEVRKMADFADIPFLLVPPLRSRGDGKVLRDDGEVSGWEYNSVKGILTDVQLAGVLVDEWDGDLAQRVAQLYYVISAREHGWIMQRGRPEFVALDPVYRQQVWALAACDHVGVVTAEALLAQFGTLRAVMSADKKALQRVEGVGPVVADSIERFAGG